MKKVIGVNLFLMFLVIADILLAVCGFYLFFDFQNNKLVEISDLNNQLVDLQGSNGSASSLNWLVSQTSASRGSLDLYFITKETVANFIGELEAASVQANVGFKLNTLEVRQDSPILAGQSYLNLEMRIDGNFSDTFHFLKIIESLPYRIRINSAGINMLENQNNLNKKNAVPSWYMTINFDLLSYIDK